MGRECLLFNSIKHCFILRMITNIMLLMTNLCLYEEREYDTAVQKFILLHIVVVAVATLKIILIKFAACSSSLSVVFNLFWLSSSLKRSQSVLLLVKVCYFFSFHITGLLRFSNARVRSNSINIKIINSN